MLEFLHVSIVEENYGGKSEMIFMMQERNEKIALKVEQEEVVSAL